MAEGELVLAVRACDWVRTEHALTAGRSRHSMRYTLIRCRKYEREMHLFVKLTAGQ